MILDFVKLTQRALPFARLMRNTVYVAFALSDPIAVSERDKGLLPPFSTTKVGDLTLRSS